ncbi:MAG TPA: YciI-like protein [Polyangiales bacterium]|nr:YciI-like protein [Polyangiales bacterium]
MKHFVLMYEFGEDFLTRRGAFRGEHLALARAAVARGELVLGGALVDEASGLLVFTGETAEVAEGFARVDPYVLNGVVEQYRVREWVTVVGRDALHSV